MDPGFLDELMLGEDTTYHADLNDVCLDDSDDEMLLSDVEDDDNDGDGAMPCFDTIGEIGAHKTSSGAKQVALVCIESCLQSLVESIAKDEPPSLRLLGRKSTQSAPCPVRSMSFPGRTPEEAWKFTVALRVIELIHEALVSGVVTTKRDIYYKDPALFGNQNVVNRLVDDIARTFDVPRSALSVSAAAKGLAAGCFSIIHQDSTRIQGISEQEGMLIPELPLSDQIEMDNARWILVIEKEAVFRSLTCSDFWDDITSHGIVVTGKGYPDIHTRALIRRFVDSTSHRESRIPVYGLVDYDPDGMGILSAYKHGSITLAHENASLISPSMQWLGVRSKDIVTLNDGAANQHLLELTPRDRRKACKMLEWSQFDETSEDCNWRLELQIMLMLNTKAEIQALESARVASTLVPWLRSSLLLSASFS